ncbi:hypothetical protein ACFSSC_06495 [Corynebacterium mendelii]|uniref:Alpha/beta hydrolase n=1 Tax=Corynebacterium mendelii TaxID=2765362 RepID=A0A939E1C0_9CORY|nr:hypothetical protein [Corynebacterium mendelii]MBN9644624.1 hypothetical protein [Corynebacterium mendelii]
MDSTPSSAPGRVSPGSRPVPIPNRRIADRAVDQELVADAVRLGVPQFAFLPEQDAWAMVVAVSRDDPRLAGMTVFASLGGLTDRSRIEAGILTPHQGMDTVLSAVFEVPRTWRGACSLIPFPGDIAVPDGTDAVAMKQFWLAAISRSVLFNGPEMTGPRGKSSLVKAPDASCPEAVAPPERWQREHVCLDYPGAAQATVITTAGTGPVLVVFDGNKFLDAHLDHYLAAGCPLPRAMVFIGHGDSVAERNRDLIDCPDFPGAVARIAGRLSAGDKAMVAGSSYGGVGAVRTTLAHPGVFSTALAYSPPYAALADTWPVTRAGKDTVIISRGGSLEWLLTDGFTWGENTLRNQGVTVIAGRFAGGHDMACWREDMARDYVAAASGTL